MTSTRIINHHLLVVLRLRDRLALVLIEFDFYAAVAFGAAALGYLHWRKLALLALPPLVIWRIARLSKDAHNDLHLLIACYIVWGLRRHGGLAVPRGTPLGSLAPE
jgi:hypothetical protein